MTVTKDFLIELICRAAKETNHLDKVKFYKKTISSLLLIRMECSNNSMHLNKMTKLYRIIKILILKDSILLPTHEYYRGVKSMLKDKTDEYIEKACETYINSRGTLTSVLEMYIKQNDKVFKKAISFDDLRCIESDTIFTALQTL